MRIECSHRLPDEEVRRRISTLLQKLQRDHADQISDPQTSWNGARTVMSYSVKIMGFRTEGAVSLGSGKVTLDGSLPLGAKPFSRRIEATVREKLEQLLAAPAPSGGAFEPRAEGASPAAPEAVRSAPQARPRWPAPEPPTAESSAPIASPAIARSERGGATTAGGSGTQLVLELTTCAPGENVQRPGFKARQIGERLAVQYRCDSGAGEIHTDGNGIVMILLPGGRCTVAFKVPGWTLVGRYREDGSIEPLDHWPGTRFVYDPARNNPALKFIVQKVEPSASGDQKEALKECGEIWLKLHEVQKKLNRLRSEASEDESFLWRTDREMLEDEKSKRELEEAASLARSMCSILERSIGSSLLKEHTRKFETDLTSFQANEKLFRGVLSYWEEAKLTSIPDEKRNVLRDLTKRKLYDGLMDRIRELLADIEKIEKDLGGRK